MSKQALVITKNGRITPNGRERTMQVRAGAKGTGQIIGNSVTFWPWSSASCDQADRYIAHSIRTAEELGYTVEWEQE